MVGRRVLIPTATTTPPLDNGRKESHTNIQISADPGIELGTLWLQSRDLTTVPTTLIVVKIAFRKTKVIKVDWLGNLANY